MAKSIEQRVGDLEQIFEDLPGILNIRFGQAKSERDEIKARVAGVDARVASLDARVAGIDARFASVDAKIAGVDAKIAGVDAKIETLNARMANFELSIEQVKVELGALPRVIGQILTERLRQPT